MRSLLLTSSALFLLAGGIAMADGHGGGSSTTNVYVPVKNADALGGSSAATSGSSATTANGNTLTATNSGNTTTTNAEWTSITKTLTDVGNTSLSFMKTDVHQDIKLATSSNNGEVKDIVFVGGGGGGGEGGRHGSGGGSVRSGDASISYGISGASGINTVQQNTGNASLQQNSVALGSYVSGGSTGFNGF